MPAKNATSAIPHGNLRPRLATSKRLGIPLYVERHRMAIQARSVLPGEFADQIRWKIPDFFMDRFLGVGQVESQCG